ncbi:MAG: UDP-N-acetylglucosamine--LPS N-acetylglucosamine transferase [Actinomycetota bacterium]
MADLAAVDYSVEDELDGAGRARVLLVASGGGHLAQLMELRPWWQYHDRRWVTFDQPDTRSKLGDEYLIAAHHPTTRNARNTVRNWALARRVLGDYRPDVVISTGAGVAFPFFVEARRRGVPTVYLEVYDRIDSPTLTGRLCHPFTTTFLTQWPEQQALYRNSTLIGPIY